MGSDGSNDGARAVKPGATSLAGGSPGPNPGGVAPASAVGVGKATLTARLSGDAGAAGATPDSAANDGREAGSTAGRAAVEAMDVARSLVPAYQRAVNALDAIAVAELARNIVGTMQIAEAGRQRVIASLAADRPPQATATQDERTALKHRLTTELAAFERELAIKLGPQQLDGVPVMGSLIPAQLGGDPLAYVVNESSLVIELLGVVSQIVRITGARIGMCPPPSPATVQVVIHLVEPWRSRPINFAFLVAALRKLGVWDEVSAVKSNVHGKTLGDTQHKVAAQAEETGALADVGDLDTEGLTGLLHEAPPGTKGARPGGQWIDDRAAQNVLERLAAASPTARGPLVQQIARMGKLGKVCDHLPKQAVQSLRDAIAPFDAPAAAMLVPFFEGKPGGGRSMHKVYEDKVMDNLHDGNPVRGYLWTLLDTAHNALTMGFEHEYSEAYDAHEAGLTTDAAFHGAGGKALGKAAAIALVSAATGGAAAGFSEGFAAGLGAGRSVASLIGAGAGGFGAGVGGHLAGDTFDQAFNGKQGFDSFGAYMKSGAEGGFMGTVLGGISVGAGQYLNKGGGQVRPIDQLAARYPQNAGVLERLRTAGFGAGARTRAAAVKLKVTATELADMIASGLVVPQPAFATAFADLPPGSQLEISARPPPMQMAAGRPGASTEPKLELDDIKPVEPKPADARPAKSRDEAKADPPPDSHKPAAARSGDIQPDELEHFDKGHFTEEGKLKGGGHGHANIAELQRRGYEELSPAEVAKLRAKEQAYEEARTDYRNRDEAQNVRRNARRQFRANLPNESQLGKLDNPSLPEPERIRLETIKANNTLAVKQWEASNPAPPKLGKEPKPEDFGLDPRHVALADRRYYYHEPMGPSGARTGGVSSRNPIHVDGHTWFPPGWQADPIMKLLETQNAGIAETSKLNKGIVTATERSAWIKKSSDGSYSIASPTTADPKSAGYIKATMITPLDGAQRTVFPEMKQ